MFLRCELFSKFFSKGAADNNHYSEGSESLKRVLRDGRVSEAAERASELAGKALDLIGRASEQARRASEEAGRALDPAG